MSQEVFGSGLGALVEIRVQGRGVMGRDDGVSERETGGRFRRAVWAEGRRWRGGMREGAREREVGDRRLQHNG